MRDLSRVAVWGIGRAGALTIAVYAGLHRDRRRTAGIVAVANSASVSALRRARRAARSTAVRAASLPKPCVCCPPTASDCSRVSPRWRTTSATSPARSSASTNRPPAPAPQRPRPGRPLSRRLTLVHARHRRAAARRSQTARVPAADPGPDRPTRPPGGRVRCSISAAPIRSKTRCVRSGPPRCAATARCCTACARWCCARAARGGGIEYRLVAGPIANAAKAARYCARRSPAPAASASRRCTKGRSRGQ